MNHRHTARLVAAIASVVLTFAQFQGIALLADEDHATASPRMAAVSPTAFAQ